MRRIFIGTLVVLTIALINGCANRKITRVDPNETIDLSGRWNDSDSRLVSEEMIGDVLTSAWLPRYTKANDKRPVVVVGLVENKRHEHINSETFIKDIEKAIIRDGNIRLVVAGEKRNELRKERAEQQEIPIFFRLEDHIIIIKLQVYDVLGNKINYQNSLYIYKTENSHPVILSFSTSKYAIRDNETIELSWNVKNATRVTCSILEGELELYGKKTITISFREEDPMKIYLYAENEYGKEERSVNINLKNGFIFTLILVIFQIACYGFLGLKVLEMLIARLK